MENTLTLLETIAWAEDRIYLCAGQPVIPASNFETLSVDLAAYPEVHKTAEDIYNLLREETKRFTACGANHSDRFGVLRKNPKGGWQYIVDLITK
jgi:hypothetical protein